MSADLLLPFEPCPADPFDLEKAGHLWRRAGLGASLEQRETSVKLGPARAVESLFRATQGDDVDAFATTALLGEDADRLRAYRLWRLLAGRMRLSERMSLFWHCHFATSLEKVQDTGAMARQLSTFDELGLADFASLCGRVLRDPAMLRWLDGDRSKRGQPNENLARELFELFALGRGSYGEADVKAAARALTGWVVDAGIARFDARRHDDGEKDLFGVHGKFGVDQLVATTVAQPECARFMARKLLECFVHPEPSDEEIDALAELWRRQQGKVGEVLRVLFRSRLFFSSRARRSRVMDPLELVVVTVRSLGATASPRELADAASKLGQTLLSPPSVEGWPRDRAWLTSSTWLLRANFAVALLREKRFEFEPAAAELLGTGSTGERLERAILLVCDGVLSNEARSALREYVAALGNAPTAVEILHGVLTLPEAQLA